MTRRGYVSRAGYRETQLREARLRAEFALAKNKLAVLSKAVRGIADEFRRNDDCPTLIGAIAKSAITQCDDLDEAARKLAEDAIA